MSWFKISQNKKSMDLAISLTGIVFKYLDLFQKDYVENRKKYTDYYSDEYNASYKALKNRYYSIIYPKIDNFLKINNINIDREKLADISEDLCEIFEPTFEYIVKRLEFYINNMLNNKL